jgi:hypothetical protein
MIQWYYYFLSYRLTKSSEVLAKSTIPPVGCVTRPRKPLPKPLTKPDAPPRIAPVTGFVTTPVTPLKKPYKTEEIEAFLSRLPLSLRKGALQISYIIF